MNFQDPATNTMADLIDLHHDIMFFLIIIGLFVASILLQFIHNYSFDQRVTVELPSSVQHNLIAELVWTIIPSVILLIIAVPSFSLLYTLEAQTIGSTPDLTVKIIGHQWYWGYEYDTGKEIELRMLTEDELLTNYKEIGGFRLLETNKKLVLPINQRIRLLVTSDDVIHSWTIPSFAIKIDAIPGRLNQVFLRIIRPGLYYGQCSEICGVNHGFMPIAIRAVKLFPVNEVEALPAQPASSDDDGYFPLEEGPVEGPNDSQQR